MPMLSDLQREALLAELGGLRKFCLSLTGNPADGDDLLQVTVERVLAKGIPADAHVARWVYRVCKNAWIDELRAREVRHRYPQLVVDEEGDPRSAEQAAAGQREPPLSTSPPLSSLFPSFPLFLFSSHSFYFFFILFLLPSVILQNTSSISPLCLVPRLECSHFHP